MDQQHTVALGVGLCPAHGSQEITAMGAETVTLACGYVVM
jgi:hypothetical protein